MVFRKYQTICSYFKYVCHAVDSHIQRRLYSCTWCNNLYGQGYKIL